MISSLQVESWTREGESEVLELKRTTGERKAAMQTLCGMLNHRGGRVVFGVEDDGRVVGQDVGGQTLETLAQEIKEIDPPVFPTIDRVDVALDRQVLVVTVSQGSNRPYSCRGRAYRRVGSTTQELSREEYHRMLFERLHGEQRWENLPAAGWTVADLDLAEITRTIEEAIRRGRSEDPGTREPASILRGLGLLKDGALLRAGIVLFGRPERLEAEFPQCLLRVARFKGVDKTGFLDNRQFSGNAFGLLLHGERFLRESLPVAGRVEPGLFERIDDPLYPPVALREALANAVCHRDYSIGGGSIGVGVYDNKLEITSSGTLHFGLTAEALFEPHESLPWNPLIARVLYRRGMIEEWGRGTLKIAELAAQAGLPHPEIEEVAGCVTVRFFPSRYIPPLRVSRDLTERQQRVLAMLGAEQRGLALREIKQGFPEGVEEWDLKADLGTLRSLGLIKATGYARGARWTLAR